MTIVPKGYGPRSERESPHLPGYEPFANDSYELIASAESTVSISQLCCYWPNPVPHPNYLLYKITTCGGCFGIVTTFSPQAAPAEKLFVTNFNFDCMTRWKPCADEEDIMPGVGARYWRELEAQTLAIRPAKSVCGLLRRQAEPRSSQRRSRPRRIGVPSHRSSPLTNRTGQTPPNARWSRSLERQSVDRHDRRRRRPYHPESGKRPSATDRLISRKPPRKCLRTLSLRSDPI